MSIVVFPIAVVGLACRFPGRASSLSDLWQILEQGRDAVTEIPAERWPRERFFHPRRSMPGRGVSFSAGIIENIYDFDAEFFGISSKEAQAMDPQQRLMLELAWEAMEDALIPPSELAGSQTAVFVGAASPDAGTSHADDICATTPYSMTGTNLSIISNRVSHIFDLRGPSITIDTACSSAMHALHQACQTLACGGAETALAGGVNVLLSPYPFVGFSQAHMLSPGGRCKVFDAEGNGYARSEGGGLLLLQPLDAALAQGRRIHGVIRAVGLNADGRTQGIALPSSEAQEDLLRRVYDGAGIAPDGVAYMEAHGTGTAAGDPVETRAIGRAIGMRRKKPLLTGSVKCHLGHLETASAMAGICKTLLVLHKRRVPAQIHISRLNPAIDFKGLNLRVPLRMAGLPRTAGPPLAGVNSFGFGGANGHMLLQAAPPAPRKRPRRQPGAKSPVAAMSVAAAGSAVNYAAANNAAYSADSIIENPPFFLSARSEASLRRLAGQCADLLESGSVAPYDLAAGMALMRETMPHRLVARAPSAEAVKNALRAASLSNDEGGTPSNEAAAAPTEGETKHCLLGECSFTRSSSAIAQAGAVFAYSGNGGQWAGMGQKLMEEDSAFAAAAEEAARLLLPLAGRDYAALLRHGVAEEDMARTELAQPLLFVLQVGLTRAFQARGIEPGMVLGHSVGEVAAAWACGALTLPDAALVMHHRSLLQGRTAGQGRMAAVNLRPEAAQDLPELRDGRLELAGINSPESVTLAGEAEALAAVGGRMRERNIFFRELPLNYAFHSRAMDQLEAPLREALRGLRPRRARIPFISTVTGGEIDGRRLNADYWWRNIRLPVRFGRAVDAANAAGGEIFMEVGPHPVLQHYMRAGLRRARREGAALSSLTRGNNCAGSLRQAWRKAWIHGWPLRLEKFFPHPFQAGDLPHYPWNRQFHAIAATPECANLLRGAADHPLLGWRKPGQDVWENTLDLEIHPWLKDHQVGEAVFFPAAAYLEMAMAAARLARPDRTVVELVNTAIYRPMIFRNDAPLNLRAAVGEADGEVRLLCRPHMRAEDWVTFARGRMVESHPPLPLREAINPESFGEEQSAEDLYALTSSANMRYGPAFRPVTRLWRKGGRILARLAPPDGAAAEGMLIPPPLLDGGLQLIFKLIEDQVREHPAPRLPYWFDRCTLYRPGRPEFALARLEKAGERTVTCSLDLLDAEGGVLLRLANGRARLAERLAPPARPSVYASRLVPAPRPCMEQECPAPLPSPQSLNIVYPSFADGEAAREEEILSLRHTAVLAMAMESMEALAENGLARPGAIADLGRSLENEALPYYMLELLERHDLVRRQADGSVTVPRRPDYLPAFEDIWRTLLADDPAGQAEIQMLAHVWGRLRRAGARLSETAAPLENEEGAAKDLSLEQGVGAIEEQFFRHSQAPRRNNALLAEAARAWLQACPEGLSPRIMEVGAAPGGLPGALPPLVKQHDRRYMATDGDAEALERLRGAVSAPRNGRLSFRVMSLPGGNAEERCHCLLLGYCLHQADNAESFLIRCREMLVPGGLLALAELAPNPLLDAFFGQNPRWWAHSPSPTEPASPLMPPQGWSAALRQAGFTDIRLISSADGEKDCFVLLARAPETPLRPTSETPPQSKPEASPEEPLPEAAFPGASPLGAQKQQRLREPATRFVLLADSRPHPQTAALLGSLRQGLESAGAAVLMLRPGKLRLTGREWRLRPGSAENWAALWLALAEEKTPLVCVDCLGLRGGPAPEHERGTPPKSEEYPENQAVTSYKTALLRVTALTQMARGWDKAKRPPLQLRVVTAGAQISGTSDPSQSCVLGAARVLMNEMPALDIRCLDVDGLANPDLPQALLRELARPDAEREVLLRGSRRYAPRLECCDISNYTPAEAPEGEPASLLRCLSPGHLDSLAWRPVRAALPGPGEILARVRATGLNFRDVMWAMGLLPEEALENGFSGAGLGIECAGEVEAVGPGTPGFFPGQRIICFGPGCFASHVRTAASAAAPMPEGWSFAQAASVPVAFFTAWYALNWLARLKPGERVLIHGAAGGVGMAAIQVAAHLGLEVLATAGTQNKRRLLRLCGVEHVLDSRSYAFREQVLTLTSGRGVDAVLNSLAGEGIAHSLDTLRPFGRFLELGKRDFFADNPLRLRPFRNNISFFGIDVDQLMRERPDLGQTLFREIMELFSKGIFRPLPHTVFAAHEAEEAFRAMQQSRHIGKIVVEAPRPEPAPPNSPMPARKDGSYIVTGGMGGFGLASARFLAEQGAGALVLVGRGGPRDAEAREALNAMRGMGCAVRETLADAADKNALFAALNKALRGLPPLRGIIHAAAALDDAVAANMTPARIRRVFEPKVAGAFNLHEYSLSGAGKKPGALNPGEHKLEHLDKDLDFFILYSSATTLMGNPGQANYVAANAALEGLAAMRRAMSLPALAVGWGAVADAGMLARDPSALRSLRAVGGITPMSAEAALRMLPALHGADLCAPAVLTADWKKICRLPVGATPRLDELRPENEGAGEAALSLRESVAGKTPEQAAEIITSAVTVAVASVLRVAPSAIRPAAPLADMGMDSLMAVELGLALEEMLGCPPPAHSLGAGTSVRDMAESIHSLLCGNAASENNALRKGLESRHGISVNDDFANAVRKKAEARP